MKTHMARTSLESYDHLKAEGFAGQPAIILRAMKPGVIYTRRQLSRMTGLETSAVAGRVNKLVEDKQVVECGTVRCAVTGRNVTGIRLAGAQAELLQ